MESKKDNLKTFLKVSLITILMTLVCALYVALKPFIARAEESTTTQKPVEMINIGFDTYLRPITNNYDGWQDTYLTYLTTNYAYIYIEPSLIDSEDDIQSVFITLAFEFTSQSNIVYTNNQENECIAEFTTYYGAFSSSIDTYLFDYYIPVYDNLKFGEDVYYTFYTDLDWSYQPQQKLLLRIKRAWFNALDTKWYPNITPTSINNEFDTQYYYDKGFKDGKSVGIDLGKKNGDAEGFARGYNKGLLESSADYGISDLLYTIFDTPFSVMYNLFSFTLFGTTAWTIIISLTTLLLVLWLIKRFLT